MYDSASIPSRSMLALFTFLAGFALSAAAATDARVIESYGKLPLQFEANRGQTHKDVRFLSRGPGYSLYLTASDAVLVLSSPDADAKRVALRMSLVGAAREPAVTGVDELPGKATTSSARDPAKWRTNVPTYAKVHYQNVYPGIDLVYYGNQRQLEYDFVVAPGADRRRSCSVSRARTDWRSTPRVVSCCTRRAETSASTSPSSTRTSTASAARSTLATYAKAPTGLASKWPRMTQPGRWSSIRWCSPTRPTWAATAATSATPSPSTSRQRLRDRR